MVLTDCTNNLTLLTIYFVKPLVKPFPQINNLKFAAGLPGFFPYHHSLITTTEPLPKLIHNHQTVYLPLFLELLFKLSALFCTLTLIQL